MLLCSFIQESNYLQKVGQHTQKISRRKGGGGYSSCHRSLRKATAQSLRSAGLPRFCANCAIRSKDFYFLPHSGYLRLVNREPERRAVVVLMARFASPPIIPENLLLHGYIVSLKTPLFWATKELLNVIKEKAKYKMHLSRR